MSNCDQSSQWSPQPSTSGLPLEVEREEDSPGSSVPSVDPNPQPQRSGQKRKIEYLEASEEESEASDDETASGAQKSWVVEKIFGLKLKLKLKRQRTSPVLPEHHETFKRLLEDPVVKKFLTWDKDLRVSDKYLLSMVIAYFSRAGLFSWQYQRIHFFLALKLASKKVRYLLILLLTSNLMSLPSYLASDMEEDNQAPKQSMFSFLYGKSRFQIPLFHKLRFQFVRSMDWRTRVTREECEEIQAFDPDLWVWGRDRAQIP